MPKDTTKKKAPAPVAASPSVKHPTKGGGKRGAQPAVPKAKSASASAVKAKVKPKLKRAIVTKLPVVLDESDGEPRRGDDEEDEGFPDDGMELDMPYDDEQLQPGMLDFLDQLNNDDEEEEVDDDELEYAAGGDDVQEDDEPAAKTVRKRSQTGLQLISRPPTALRTPSKVVRPSTAAMPSIASPESRLFTPYVARVNPKDASKPLLSLQSPHTRTLFKNVARRLRTKAVTHDAFPEVEALLDEIAECFVSAAAELDLPSRILRYTGDPVYQEVFNRLSKRAIISLRSAMISTGRDLCGPGYGLGAGRGSPAQNKAYIEMLSTHGNHVYRVLETEENPDGSYRVTKRSGPYRDANIATIILQEFFTSHEQMAVVAENQNMFNPIPLPAVAFAATVMQCALRDWQTGVRVKSSSDFSADEWSAHYNNHIRELERMRDAKPGLVDKWLRKLWKDCWSATRQSLAGDGEEDSFITQEELEDFDDIELDA